MSVLNVMYINVDSFQNISLRKMAVSEFLSMENKASELTLKEKSSTAVLPY